MKAGELKKKSQPELKKLLASNRRKLHRVRFGILSNKLKNYCEIKKTKKGIARISTMINFKGQKPAPSRVAGPAPSKVEGPKLKTIRNKDL